MGETPVKERVAGRDLDAEIAEQVMGATWRPLDAGDALVVGFNGLPKPRPGDTTLEHKGTVLGWRLGGALCAPSGNLSSYSTDIASAWTVVEEMGRRGFHARLNSPFAPGMRYFAGFTPHNTTGWNGRPDYEQGADTMALAICLAALEVVNDESSGASPTRETAE